MPAQELCISVAFLQPGFHGRRDRSQPEWPPSPLRLFQALVAGAAARWGEDGGRTNLMALAHVADAFRWLERVCEHSPPDIIAPRSEVGSTYVLSIPDNRMDLVAAAWARGNYSNTGDANPATHRTMKTVRPTHLLDGDTLYYLFLLPEGLTDADKKHVDVVTAAARNVVALGWGIDVAIGDARVISDEDAGRLAGERWRGLPTMSGSGNSLRIPVAGTFQALTGRHELFLNRLAEGARKIVPPLSTFRSVAYARTSEQLPRPFAAFTLRPVDPDACAQWRAFRQERAACVAAMLRHAAWQAAKDDLDLDSSGQPRLGAWRTREWAEQCVAGHGPRKPNGRFVDDNWPRFSYLPLPTIDPRGSVGMIRRVLIAEPLPQLGGDGRPASWAAHRLVGLALRDEQTGRDTALLEQLADGDAVLARYAANDNPALEWVSVTPVILPGYDDARPAKRERLLRECLAHAGYEEAVESLEARPAAWLADCVPTQMFRRPAYLRHLPALHVRIHFREPTVGPVALGAGRHCGLGVFAACREDAR
ncbi:MAG TPA: type I-U CRISPR-associated protein Csb2 [Phycisphaerae bacterium]|nr:type I-U CRISPR-associated protein Csb2 [Phycisphaerae bacterium]